ncbi:hypothetical protein ACSNOI_18220 [Actinomadura kijaniata]|uniref:hypothetical protein n=1 Tax=Actinomadura kijaniata TaxID=46161 RepID=UPI003F1B9E84
MSQGKAPKSGKAKREAIKASRAAKQAKRQSAQRPVGAPPQQASEPRPQER